MSDTDSLFGSPPPSPKRGRSPSLALPESSGWRMDAQMDSQNVGTIALPGSHNYSEISVSSKPVLLDKDHNIHPKIPSSFQKRAPQATQAAQPIVKSPVIIKNGVLQLRPTSLPSHQQEQGPRRSIPNERTDHTLRNLVGLVSHFQSLTRSSNNIPAASTSTGMASTYTSLGSAENPIDVDDYDSPNPANAVNNALVALASTVTNALKQCDIATSSAPCLTTPTVNTVLHHIKNDSKLIPILKATHDYLADMSRGSAATSPHRSHSKEPSTPQNVKRKHEDMDAQITNEVSGRYQPSDVQSDRRPGCQLTRGRRVLGDLLALFERGFVKARMPPETGISHKPPTKRQKVAPESDQSVSEIAGIDSQRMTEWLSSVPSVIEPIIDSQNIADLFTISPGHLELSVEEMMPTVSDTLDASKMTTSNFDFSESIIEGFDMDLGLEIDWSSFMTGSQNANKEATNQPVTLEGSPIEWEPEVNSIFGVFSTQATSLVSDTERAAFDSRYQTAEEPTTDPECQSVGSYSTLPTASGASTPGGATPLQRMISPTPIPEMTSNSAKIRSEGRGVILTRVKDYQTQLRQELENVKMERWKLLIEKSVLQEFGKIEEGSLDYEGFSLP